MTGIIYRALENPLIYDIAQKILGGKRAYNLIQNTIREVLSNIQYDTILDVGCGTGLFRDCFKGQYTGIDINGNYIQQARLKKSGTFIVGDATNLPFDDEMFDLIFTLGVLHHLDNEQSHRMLTEMMRVCKRGGHILIIDGVIPSNRLNILGYTLARLDRGRYKVYPHEFREMIDKTYKTDMSADFITKKSFPHEYVIGLCYKRAKDNV